MHSLNRTHAPRLLVLVDLASIGFSIPGSNDAHGPGLDLVVVVDLPALHQIPRPGSF